MKAKIINCKKAGVREAPWLAPPDDEIIIEEIDKGEEIEILDKSDMYNWTGKQFYKIETPHGKIGYVLKNLIEE
jgi:hypothetical protein